MSPQTLIHLDEDHGEHLGTELRFLHDEEKEIREFLFKNIS